MKMSACGWPEPSTGISWPRGQCGHALSRARERVQLADRPLQVLLADLVVGCGHPPPIGRPARLSLALHQDLRPVARRTRRSRAARRAAPGQRPGLQELQRLHVQQAGRVADDVGVAQRLQELLGPVEIAHPDPHRAQSLRDVGVRAGAGQDPVLGGEPDRLLVELGDRDPRVEHLDRVDLVEHRQQVLVVGHRVHPVERVRHVDEPALALDLGDRLLQRHPARDLLVDEQADDLALVGRLDLLADDHLDPVGLGPRLERAGDLVVIGDGDRAQAPRPCLGEQHLDRGRAVVGVVGVHVQVDVDQRPFGHARPQARVAGAVVAARDEPA